MKQILKKIEHYLAHAPEGGLKLQKRNGKMYYYHQYKNPQSDSYIKTYIDKSLKEKPSNYLLVAVLQAMLAVCRGIKVKNAVKYGFFSKKLLTNGTSYDILS